MGLLQAIPSWAQAYPSKPLRFVVPYAAGGPLDIMGRIIAQKLSDRWGQPVLVDNRVGAGGNIGAEFVARSAPDGYTLYIMTSSQIMSVPIFKKLPYDPVKSFTAISPIGNGPLMLVGHPSFAPKTVKELIELAKSKPEALSYSSAGNGSINHYAGALFANAVSAKMLHVPHKGGAPAFFAVMGGEVNLMFATLPLSLTQIRAGKVKAYGITATKRSPLVPNVAPIAETVPGYEAITWWSITAPAGLPAPVLKRLNTEIVAILNQPESAQRLSAEGAEPWPLSSEAFTKVLQAELEKWTRVAREIGIRAE